MAERRPGNPEARGRPSALPERGTLRLPADVRIARASADEILERARAEAEALRQKARQERDRAFEQGMQQGREQALARAAELLATARAEAARQTAAAEPGLVRLAVQIAERLVHRELAQDPGAIADLAAGLLREARGQQPLELVLHPTDAEALDRDRPALAQVLAETPEIRLQTDPGIGRASCVVRGPDLAIDGRLTTRLERIERALLGESAEELDEL